MDNMNLTPEDVMKSYEYRIAIKSLQQKIPYFVDSLGVNDDLNEYSLIFIKPVIDITMIAKDFGCGIKNYIKYLTTKDPNTPQIEAYINVFFVNLTDEQVSKLKNMEKQIERILKQIHETTIIPPSLKLPKKLSPSVFYVVKSMCKYPEMLEHIHTT